MSRRKHRRSATAQTAVLPVATPVFAADPARRNLPADARALIANARNDITIPFFTGVLAHVDDTLIQRGDGKGLKIYDEIERDTHAFAMLQKRKKTLLARPWEVKPASDAQIDQDAADLVREVLGALPFDRICEDLLDATLKGYAISEIVWQRDGARILPARIIAHDQRRFVFDLDWKPRLLTWADMQKGEPLPERKFLVHRFGVKGNNPYGLGLGSRLFWAVLFKREGIAFWLHFLEKFAGPTIVGKVPYGTLPAEQNRLLNTLMDIRTSSAVTVPIGTDVDFLEAARGGSVSYQDFLGYWDKQISICVTGETLTTDIGQAGSRAASETHAEILDQLVDADGDLLSTALKDQLIRWIVDYNMPGAGLPEVWRLRTANEKAEAETRKAKADAASTETAALEKALRFAARIEDDSAARAWLVASGLLDGQQDEVIDALVALRRDMPAVDVPPAIPGAKPLALPPPNVDPNDAMFAVRPRRV